MRIFYDGQIYSLQTFGGISRYFANIISRLPTDDTPIITTFSKPDEDEQKKHDPVHPNLKTFQYSRFLHYRLAPIIEKYYFRKVTANEQFQLAHPTYHRLLTQQEFSEYRCPVVLTIHDMIHELFPKKDFLGIEKENKRKAVFSAQAIICVSENTKKDLLELYPTLENKITVTYLASEIDINMSYGDETVPTQPYLLYVGSRDKVYKNFDSFLLAFSKVISINSDIKLCVVGSPFNKDEIKQIQELKLTDYIENYGHISDSHLAKLYRCSLAFIYPSLYEGFGIPPLEAMSCGTVAVVSNISSIPEVVGDAGILFNPQAIGDLADIILFLIHNPAERDRLIAKGFQRAKDFSWDKTAAKTIEVYRAVSNS
ncbi:glycosyltransferase family 4 protein [Calothrix sp. NIES-2098]|uniref:glycosyltransferase family 4 protein n=1 Tax=Calothrix sp. NIES-2098 TaxID=1954171 RepID=UPI000B60293F|nr:group 1 glycosyl transferase [Calothrix sp. NIES-2098]